ncbi:MAG: T9SS type A sorting domain-containing protein [Bacteroidales bacterium]|nr:T9SS type A sorting domain-containing protein [Bacteroidales bacterium]
MKPLNSLPKVISCFFAIFLISISLYGQGANDRVLVGNIDSDFNDEVIFFNRSSSGASIRAIDLVSGASDTWIGYDNRFANFIQEEDFVGIGDVNGNGQDDLILVDYTDNNGIAVLVVDLIDGSTIKQISNTYFNGWKDDGDSCFVADVNKDGRADLVLINMSGTDGFLRVMDLTTGMPLKTIYYSQVSPSLNGWLDAGDKMFIGNVGGSSSMDLVLVNTAYSSGAIRAIDIMTGTSIRWISHGAFGGLMDESDRILFGDVDGDGFDDLVFVNSDYNDTVNPMIMVYNINKVEFETDFNMDSEMNSFYRNGFFRAWVDPCDKAFLLDVDLSGTLELVLVNIAKSSEAIRVIDLNNKGSNIVNSALNGNGWFDYADLCFTAKYNSSSGLSMINTNMKDGFLRSINLHDGSNVLWCDYGSVYPSMNGWLDGINQYSLNCDGICVFNENIVYDSIHVANGNYLRKNKPFSRQLFPRDEKNMCFVPISGYFTGNSSRVKFKIDITSYNEVKMIDHGTEFYYASIDMDGHFKIDIPIEAGLFEYDFYYYLEEGGKEIPIADDVVCGDVFLVTGQSNAVAEPSDESATHTIDILYGDAGIENNFYGRFLRSYREFGIIENSDWFYSKVSLVGVWGLKMQYEITKSNKVPTCVINGAVGGTSIDKHIPNISDPYYSSDTSFLLGSLILRNTYAGYAGCNTAILLYNGESEVKMGASFIDEFEPLYNSLNNHFPNTPIYLTQISSYDYADEVDILKVSEGQRVARDIFNLGVMTSNGIGNKDTATGQHIHFTAESYVELGRRYSNLLNFELYRSNIYTRLNFYPPDINIVYRENNSLVLEFDQILDQSLSDDLNTVYRVIKFNDNYSSYDCNDIYIDGKKLVIMFNSDVFQHMNTISYAGKLPQGEYDLKCYLRNSNGVAAYTFNKFPIQYKEEKSSSIIEVVSNSNNESSQSIQSIQVYPNPVVDALNIKINELSINEKITVEILSLDGNLIDTRTCFNGALLSTVNINSGSYILIVNHEGNRWIEKFIKF